MMRKLLISVICLLSTAQAGATTVASFNDLPTDLQNCFQTNQCLSLGSGTNLFTEMHTADVAAFQYVQWNGSGYDLNWLMRYDLLTPPGTVAGTAWVDIEDNYDIAGSDTHNFTLYFYGSSSYLSQPPITLTLNDTDLADGSAFRSQYFGLVEGEPGIYSYDMVVTGDLGIELPFCLAEGCGSAAQFNLLHMNYANGEFSFNASDTRGMLFNRSNWYDCGYEGCGSYADIQSLYVHAVPLPPSLLLLISGLACGALGARRKGAMLRS